MSDIAIGGKMNRTKQDGTDWDGARLNENSIGYKNTTDYC